MGPTRMALTKPVIAAVEGHAVAGGLELAIWCDLRVAADDATFGVFCRRFGVPLVDGGTVRLPRLIGEGRALDLILSGRPVGADEALAMGLANRVVPSGTALEAAVAWAAELAALPQVCMRNDRRFGHSPSGTFPSTRRWPSRRGSASTACPRVRRSRVRPGSRAVPVGVGPPCPTPTPERRGTHVADVAAFDFDGTLTNGGSVFDFLAAVSGRRAVLRASASLAPRLAQAAVAGGTVADDTKQELFVRVLGWCRRRPARSGWAPSSR